MQANTSRVGKQCTAICVLWAAMAGSSVGAQENEVVWADVSLSQFGQILKIEIDPDAHPSLRRLVEEQYEDFEFEPATKFERATKEEVPVASTSSMMVFFEMGQDPEKGFTVVISDYQLHAKRLTKVDPIYPKDARANGVEGKVELAFKVNIRGNPKKVKVVRSDPPGVFDKAAVRALKQWKFEARTRAGNATRTDETETIVFSMGDE